MNEIELRLTKDEAAAVEGILVTIIRRYSPQSEVLASVVEKIKSKQQEPLRTKT